MRKPKKSVRTFRPNAENLEGRQLLYAVTGTAWTHPERITLSFMPDGSQMTDGFSTTHPSNLFATMPSGWQNKVEEAAARWAAAANIQIAVVPDNGAPMLNSGAQQGDPNFGDIRIGGYALPGSIQAEARYPEADASSLAGDITFNTSLNWTTGYNLESVALHEIGHALGLDHSSVAGSVMYPTYNGQTSLQADDIAGVQSIYGAITPDTSTTPIDLTFNNLYATVQSTIANVNDVDNYRFTVPSGSNTVTVSLQSAGLSMLEPKFVIRDSAGNAVSTMSSTTMGDTVAATIGVQPGQQYTISVSTAGTNAQFGSDGAYGLSVQYSSTNRNSKPASLYLGNGTDLVVAVGQDGQLKGGIYDQTTNSMTWKNVPNLPNGLTIVSNPQLAQGGQFPTGAWVRGSDNNIYFMAWSGNGFTSSWGSIGHPPVGFANGDFFVETDPTNVGVFIAGIGNDGHLYQEWLGGDYHWYGYLDLGNAGTPLTGNVSGADMGGGWQIYNARDTSGNLVQTWYTGPTYGWLNASLGHPGAPLAGSPSTAQIGRTSAYQTFCIDANGNASIYWWIGSSWAIVDMGNPGVALKNDPSTSPVLSTDAAYFNGVNGNLYGLSYVSGSPSWIWAPLYAPSGGFIGSPSAVAEDANQAVFDIGLNGNLYVDNRYGYQWFYNINLGNGGSFLGNNPQTLANIIPLVLPNTYNAAGPWAPNLNFLTSDDAEPTLRLLFGRNHPKNKWSAFVS